MTCEEILLVYADFSVDEKKYFLSSLAFQLTILARDAYVDDAKNPTNPRLLSTINEIQHKILGHVLHLFKENSKHYPDEVLFKTLFQTADCHGYLEVLQIAFSLVVQGRAVEWGDDRNRTVRE